MNSSPPELLPTTPEEVELLRAAAQRLAWRNYRKETRPYRRTFRGIFTRREADRFIRARLRQQVRHVEALEEALDGS